MRISALYHMFLDFIVASDDWFIHCWGRAQLAPQPTTVCDGRRQEALILDDGNVTNKERFGDLRTNKCTAN